MGIEIEHKYLVKGDDYRLMACGTHEIKQGFLSRVPERVVRVRVRDDKGFITIKGKGTLPNQICRYAPREPQWWITSFVPQLQGVNPKDTVAEYTVQFNQSQKQLFDDFMKVRFPNWSGDRNKLTLVHTF